MKIAIVGTGYVGLVTGTCFAEMGNTVYCVDIDINKINKLKNGIIPIYEHGLEELLLKNVEANRLHFITDLKECLDDVDIVFSAVGTPPDEDGSADLTYVLNVARTFGENINKYTLLVTKSTVPVGTAQKVKHTIEECLKERNCTVGFDVVSNPEFLKEGTAVRDFLYPDRIVIGVESEQATMLMQNLYLPFAKDNATKILFTDIPSAEMIKYAANSMLATRISFINDIANLCDKVGANIENVRQGIGADSRIGSKFLYAGCGYGGSCFPKDVKALVKTGELNNYSLEVLKAVERVNAKQKVILFEKLLHKMGSISDKVITLWGLAFKPDTDDMRESTSLVLIDELVKVGAKVKVFDPIAMDECKRRIGDKVIYCKDKYEALQDSNALLLVTEWKEFRTPDWETMSELMLEKNIFDGRNIYPRDEVEALGFYYEGIGK